MQMFLTNITSIHRYEHNGLQFLHAQDLSTAFAFIGDLKVTPDGAMLFACDRAAEMALFTSNGVSYSQALTFASSEQPRAFDFNENQTLLAVGCSSGKIQLYELVSVSSINLVFE